MTGILCPLIRVRDARNTAELQSMLIEVDQALDLERRTHLFGWDWYLTLWELRAACLRKMNTT